MQDHTSSPASAAHDVAESGNALRAQANDWRSITEPEEILALWRALHGRWRVLDAYDEGGRRFVIARVEGAAMTDVLDERLDPSLSLRERQVACLAALGHTNKHIGHALAIATSTVATHLRHALIKLGARSRADLARRLLDANAAPIAAPPSAFADR
jgi:DNA-binding NarL/FixJ family response regulator